MLSSALEKSEDSPIFCFLYLMSFSAGKNVRVFKLFLLTNITHTLKKCTKINDGIMSNYTTDFWVEKN